MKGYRSIAGSADRRPGHRAAEGRQAAELAVGAQVRSVLTMRPIGRSLGPKTRSLGSKTRSLGPKTRSLAWRLLTARRSERSVTPIARSSGAIVRSVTPIARSLARFSAPVSLAGGSLTPITAPLGRRERSSGRSNASVTSRERASEPGGRFPDSDRRPTGPERALLGSVELLRDIARGLRFEPKRRGRARRGLRPRGRPLRVPNGGVVSTDGGSSSAYRIRARCEV